MVEKFHIESTIQTMKESNAFRCVHTAVANAFKIQKTCSMSTTN